MQKNNKIDTICKIVKSGHSYSTFAGYLFEGTINDLAQYFDSEQSIPAIARQYLRNRYVALQADLQNMFDKYPIFYSKHYFEHKWAEAIFFGIEDDTISCKLTYFELLSPADSLPRLDSGLIDLTYTPKPGMPFIARAGGHCDAINAHFGDPGIWIKGYQQGIDSLMRLQSYATPTTSPSPFP
jgi:hypothetical protein